MSNFIDKAKHKVEELTGHAKEAAGKATDDKDLQAEGKADQATGGLKQTGDKISDAAQKAKDSLTD
jgi:uncharacterized protein YjbJ (UPF0337 family)